MAEENTKKAIDAQIASKQLLQELDAEISGYKQKIIDEIAEAKARLAKSEEIKRAKLTKMYDDAVELLKKNGKLYDLIHQQAQSNANPEEERTVFYAALRAKDALNEMDKVQAEEKAKRQENAQKAREAKKAKAEAQNHA